jgi:hypothetical protein
MEASGIMLASRISLMFSLLQTDALVEHRAGE